MDITYIPVQGGYPYLCAIIDLYSRYVVGWSLSNTMSSEWCRQTLQASTEQYGVPEILNTDQGSQFTAYEFCDWVTHPHQGIRLSMDGNGRAIDNIFVERLWRSVKYEHVYLFPASDGLQCYQGLQTYFEYYNSERRHQSLEDQIPKTVYKMVPKKAA
ncbi:putative transposase [Parapedobacter composti]|uniref:Putative transposase n=2 Tax=Parapedobacter composti TaxID=623281 RepID=A0A1I1GC60_9SPHI|nr:putative transposase [Parapedobacter composti]